MIVPPPEPGQLKRPRGEIDDYHGSLLALQRECQARGLRFIPVMKMLIDRWLERPEAPGDEGGAVALPVDEDRDLFAPFRPVPPAPPPPAPPPEPAIPKNPAAVALGKLGGSKGGLARAASLSHEQRKAAATHAARERWSGADPGPTGRPRLVSEEEIRSRAHHWAPNPGDRVLLIDVLAGSYSHVPPWVQRVVGAWPDFELSKDQAGHWILTRREPPPPPPPPESP